MINLSLEEQKQSSEVIATPTENMEAKKTADTPRIEIEKTEKTTRTEDMEIEKTFDTPSNVKTEKTFDTARTENLKANATNIFSLF